MKSERKSATFRSLVAILCAITLLPGDTLAYTPQQSSTPEPAGASAKIPPEQLDSLVAPIALYPDPLLAQVLAASTYPLEIILLQRWLEKNKNLKDKELADAVAKESWDASVQALAGSAGSGEAAGRRHSVDHGSGQRLSGAAKRRHGCRSAHAQEGPGKRHSEDHRTAEGGNQSRRKKSVIVIEQANPQVVYVPSYNPVVVYGPAYYPYPPIYYPPWGYYAAGAAISFGVGVMMGAFWSGGGLGLRLGRQ